MTTPLPKDLTGEIRNLLAQLDTKQPGVLARTPYIMRCRDLPEYKAKAPDYIESGVRFLHQHDRLPWPKGGVVVFDWGEWMFAAVPELLRGDHRPTYRLRGILYSREDFTSVAIQWHIQWHAAGNVCRDGGSVGKFVEAQGGGWAYPSGLSHYWVMMDQSSGGNTGSVAPVSAFLAMLLAFATPCGYVLRATPKHAYGNKRQQRVTAHVPWFVVCNNDRQWQMSDDPGHLTEPMHVDSHVRYLWVLSGRTRPVGLTKHERMWLALQWDVRYVVVAEHWRHPKWEDERWCYEIDPAGQGQNVPGQPPEPTDTHNLKPGVPPMLGPYPQQQNPMLDVLTEYDAEADACFVEPPPHHTAGPCRPEDTVVLPMGGSRCRRCGFVMGPDATKRVMAQREADRPRRTHEQPGEPPPPTTGGG